MEVDIHVGLPNEELPKLWCRQCRRVVEPMCSWCHAPIREGAAVACNDVPEHVHAECMRIIKEGL